ncbi:DUF1145 family protein [Enterobacteriaceae bacterium LUAb1]
MLLNLGRLFMLGIWGFLLFNFVRPYPVPLNYFIHVALFFMIVMHGLQVILLKATQPQSGPAISRAEQSKIFLFGLFELLAWQKKQFSEKNK